MFFIFINDVPKILEHSAAEIYADDTTITAYADYRLAPGALSQVLQADVGKVAQWTTDDKIVLNESKTKTMLVAGKRLHKKMSSTSLTVHVNSVELEQVQSHKLLSVIIDTQLKFNEHIDNLCKKLAQRIAVLKKNHTSLTFRSTNSLLQCHDKTNHDVWLQCVGFCIC